MPGRWPAPAPAPPALALEQGPDAVEGVEPEPKKLPGKHDGRLWKLECGCGACRLILRLAAYILSTMVTELTRSPREILWWEELQPPVSLLELIPVWEQLENDTDAQELQLPPQAGRLCFLISRAPLQWSDNDIGDLEVSVDVFDTGAAINLGSIAGGTTKQDYCGFSLDEVLEASFMVGTIMDLEDEGNSTNVVDVRHCLTPLYCKSYMGDLQERCAEHRVGESCYADCSTEEYQWSRLLTLVNASEPDRSPPWVDESVRLLDNNITGFEQNETEGVGSDCSEREAFMNKVFFQVPQDRLKVAAFIDLFRFEATQEAMRYKTVGSLLVLAVGLALFLWLVQLANFLYHQFKVEDDDLRCGEVLSRKIITSTLILVTWLFPLAILRPLAGVHTMPEPFADTLLLVTPSAYSDMLVGILIIMVFAVPVMCCGGCCVAARCSCLAAPTWLLAWLLCSSAATLIGRSYWFDGFFFYVEFSMVFSLNFTWNMSAMVDLIQLLFFVSFLLEVASVITFLARYVRRRGQLWKDRYWNCKTKLEERCGEVGQPVGVRQSEASDRTDLEDPCKDQPQEASCLRQDVDPKDADLRDECRDPVQEASNPEEDLSPDGAFPGQRCEEDDAHQVAASDPDVISL